MFSVINLYQKNDGGPHTSKKMYVALGKKGCPSLAYTIKDVPKVGGRRKYRLFMSGR